MFYHMAKTAKIGVFKVYILKNILKTCRILQVRWTNLNQIFNAGVKKRGVKLLKSVGGQVGGKNVTFGGDAHTKSNMAKEGIFQRSNFVWFWPDKFCTRWWKLHKNRPSDARGNVGERHSAFTGDFSKTLNGSQQNLPGRRHADGLE